jgi:hypothetical protein
MLCGLGAPKELDVDIPICMALGSIFHHQR